MEASQHRSGAQSLVKTLHRPPSQACVPGHSNLPADVRSGDVRGMHVLGCPCAAVWRGEGVRGGIAGVEAPKQGALVLCTAPPPPSSEPPGPLSLWSPALPHLADMTPHVPRRWSFRDFFAGRARANPWDTAPRGTRIGLRPCHRHRVLCCRPLPHCVPLPRSGCPWAFSRKSGGTRALRSCSSVGTKRATPQGLCLELPGGWQAFGGGARQRRRGPCSALDKLFSPSCDCMCCLLC